MQVGAEQIYIENQNRGLPISFGGLAYLIPSISYIHRKFIPQLSRACG
jgi:hypothetical protein